jgi:hypothetical protein
MVQLEARVRTSEVLLERKKKTAAPIMAIMMTMETVEDESEDSTASTMLYVCERLEEKNKYS